MLIAVWVSRGIAKRSAAKSCEAPRSPGQNRGCGLGSQWRDVDGRAGCHEFSEVWLKVCTSSAGYQLLRMALPDVIRWCASVRLVTIDLQSGRREHGRLLSRAARRVGE